MSTATDHTTIVRLESYAVTPAKYNITGTVCGFRVDFVAGPSRGKPPASRRVAEFIRDLTTSMEVDIVREAAQEVVERPDYEPAAQWLPKVVAQMVCFMADLQDRHDVCGESLGLARDLLRWRPEAEVATG